MLVAMLWLATTGMSQTMVSMNTPSNQEYIDNLFNTIVHNANIPLVKAQGYGALDFFAKANLGADAMSWAGTYDVGGRFMHSGVLNHVVVGEEVYRLPTEEELAFLIPTIDSPDAPTFYKSGKALEVAETVKLPGLRPLRCVSDYVGSGKGIIYGLRFRRPLGEHYEKSANDDIYDPVVRKNYDYAQCRAYRYEYKGTQLVISIKEVATDENVKKVKDVDSERWWSKQTGVKTFMLPLAGNGETIYQCSQNRNVSISSESLTFRRNTGGTGFVRLYLDPQATFERATRFMHASLYGQDIYVNEPVDATEATAVSYKPVTLNVYVRTNPGSSSITYNGAKPFPYGSISTRRLSDNTLLHSIALKTNFSAEARQMDFSLTSNADNQQQLHFTFTQPALEIEAITDSIPIDYCGEATLNTSGNWMLDNESAGLFSFNEAIEKAQMSDYEDFHLPTAGEMACILPDRQISLDERVNETRNETIEFNNRNDIFYQYLLTGEYNPRPSVQTIANAMDVGDPSNFARILDLYKNSHKDICGDISGCTYNDDQIRSTIKQVFDNYKYLLDPHGAVGYQAVADGLKPEEVGVFLETAHPAKFKDTVEPIVGPIEIPAKLQAFMRGEKKSIELPKDFSAFKQYLLNE